MISTDFFEPLKTESDSWEVQHPAVQQRRKNTLLLCGEWELSVLFGEKEEKLGKVKVPYPPESTLSGIERTLKEGQRWVYRKKFRLPKDIKGRVILHFGAVDCIAEVSVNGVFALRHEGGYTPFAFDITRLVEENNELEVVVQDDTDTDYCYGKQSKKRGGMWYTPISGIWQSVWIECVCESYIRNLKIITDTESVTIETQGGDECKEIVIEGKSYTYCGDRTTIKIENPILWSPENPKLYGFKIICGEDEIESYFALRTIECKDGYIYLNKKPYYFHGVLDQGYYPGGIYTPKKPDGYKEDVLLIKSLGFNTIRKHVKIENELFYYYCDKYGLIVFQDMVNSGRYHYITDTVLPTIGFKKSFDDKPSDKRRLDFEKTLWDMTQVLYNHPSVCLYTIFNEGWGQYKADMHYEKMKKCDNTRVWNTTSGWFRKKKSDVDSEHVYFRKVKLKRRGERPLLLTEFGGYSCAVEGHLFKSDKAYGYKSMESCEDFMRELEKLYENEVVPSVKRGLSASIITQLCDVEDEINGFVTYDREVVKVDKERMQKIADALQSTFKSKEV